MIISSVVAKLRPFFFASGLLLLTLTTGVSGFMLVEDFDFWDAFYMAVITMSTVGMNEIHHINEEGRIFISFYIIFSIGIFLYFVSVITKYLFEGELRNIFKTYMNTRVAAKIKEHTIICGYGKNGSKTCDELFTRKETFAIIDFDATNAQARYETEQKVYVIEGDATTDDVMLEAGINRAKTIITTLPKDADNVFVALTARELNPQIKIISRATDESSINKLMRAGVDHVVVPDAIGGLHMANLVTKPELVEFLAMLNGVGNYDIKLEELRYDQIKPEFHDKSIKELDIRNKTGVNIIGFKDSRDGFMFNPSPDTIIKEGDVVIIIGTHSQVKSFVEYCIIKSSDRKRPSINDAV